MLAAAATLGTVAVLPAAAPALAAGPAPVRVSLPSPTGTHRTGVTELHLVDRSRPDPWLPGQPYRELMASVFYPARDAGHHPVAPQLRPLAAADFDATIGAVPPGAVDWAGTRTHSLAGAPADRAAGGYPVVLYSPGFGVPRTFGTVLAEELASRGYIVVTMDHTYEAPQVEFPGGRVEKGRTTGGPGEMDTALAARVADTRFVLDRLAELDKGRNPDAGNRRLPAGLRGSLDLSSVAMFGHSFGGATTAAAMHADRRIDAGADLDGSLFGPVVEAGLDRPFLLVGADYPEGRDPSWRTFRENQRGWVRELTFTGAQHYTFTDLQAMIPAFAGRMTMPAAEFIGTIDPARALAAQRAYLGAFFRQHLLGCREPLLDGPSPTHPEVVFE